VEFIQASLAPRYPATTKELDCHTAVITENGMTPSGGREKGLPLVDFQMKDKEGNAFFFAVSARLVLTIAGAIRGVNERNHGVEEL
jgi:hypothetical protein